MKRLIFFLIALVLANLSAWSPAQARAWNIAVIPKGVTAYFWQIAERGALQAGRDLKVDVVWRGPHRDDQIEAQIKIIEQFIDKKVDAIVLAPGHHQKLVASVKKARERGIVVVVFDSSLDGSYHQCFVATDNHAAGHLAGEHLKQLMGGRGKAMLLRFSSGSASTENREQGFIDVIRASAPQLELIIEEPCGALAGRCYRRAVSFLKQQGELQGAFAPNETSATGLLKALKADGRVGKIHFVGFDFNDQLLNGLHSGAVDAVVIQNPYQMAYAGVQAAVDLLSGKTVQPEKAVSGTLVTPANLDDPAIKAILFP